MATKKTRKRARGRPAGGEFGEVVRVRLPRGLRDQLEAMAGGEGRTVSALIRDAVEAYTGGRRAGRRGDGR